MVSTAPGTTVTFATGQLDVGVVYDLPSRWHPVQRWRKRHAVRQFLHGR